MEEKNCNICKSLKPISEYNKSSQHKSGHRNYCRDCQKKMSERYKDRLGLELTKRKKDWALNNLEKVKLSQKKTWEKHGKRLSKIRYEKAKSNPTEYLKILMRRRIRGILNSKNLKKRLSCESIVGCSYLELKAYLETKFKDGMSWENQGSWHIDHIIPLSSANTEEEIYKLCHYTNLQPLWAKDNLKKGGRLVSES